VLENNKQVRVHFVLATAGVSLIWLILLSVTLGLLVGVLISQLYRRGRRRD
jgi:NhaP-type Na+/H+ or K+/H+ antiporter